MDQNGYYEIVFSTAQKVFVLSFSGTPLPNMPVVVPIMSDDVLIASPIIADLNNDGQSDLLVSTRTGLVYGYMIRGKMIAGFPFTIGGVVENVVSVSDMEAENQIKLFALNTNGSVYAWKIPSNLSQDEQSWFQSTYNASNNRFVNQRLTPVREEVESLLPSKRVFNYPNPNISDYTNIRYYLRENAKVSIKIFDLAGDLVTSFAGPGIGQSFNEIRWNVADISSGVYLCRVEAVSASEKNVQLIKIMIVN